MPASGRPRAEDWMAAGLASHETVQDLGRFKAVLETERWKRRKSLPAGFRPGYWPLFVVARHELGRTSEMPWTVQFVFSEQESAVRSDQTLPRP